MIDQLIAALLPGFAVIGGLIVIGLLLALASAERKTK